jgi:hypothetical protein
VERPAGLADRDGELLGDSFRRPSLNHLFNRFVVLCLRGCVSSLDILGWIVSEDVLSQLIIRKRLSLYSSLRRLRGSLRLDKLNGARVNGMASPKIACGVVIVCGCQLIAIVIHALRARTRLRKTCEFNEQLPVATLCDIQ